MTPLATLLRREFPKTGGSQRADEDLYVIRKSRIIGDQILQDDNHLIIPSIREIDGEERFKVVGMVGKKLFTGVFVWRDQLPRFISVRRSNKGEERAYRAVC